MVILKYHKKNFTNPIWFFVFLSSLQLDLTWINLWICWFSIKINSFNNDKMSIMRQLRRVGKKLWSAHTHLHHYCQFSKKKKNKTKNMPCHSIHVTHLSRLTISISNNHVPWIVFILEHLEQNWIKFVPKKKTQISNRVIEPHKSITYEHDQ